VSNNIVGKTLCAFGDAAATPVLTTLKWFRNEFEAHVREGTLHASGGLAGARRRCWRGAHD
jgi:NADH-quinone oxidoreductase subunit F